MFKWLDKRRTKSFSTHDVHAPRGIRLSLKDQSPAVVERAKPLCLVCLEFRRLDSMKTPTLSPAWVPQTSIPGLTHNRPTPTVGVGQLFPPLLRPL